MSQRPCNRCGSPISPGQMFLNALGRTWHNQCFTCRGCNNPLGTGEFFPLNNEPFCSQCHSTKDVPMCGKCGQPVRRGTDFLRYDNKSFHSACFTCNQCNTELLTQDFFIHNGSRYCANCSNRLTASQNQSYGGGYSSNTGGGNYSSGGASTYGSGGGGSGGASTYGSGGGYGKSTSTGASTYGSGGAGAGSTSVYGSGGGGSYGAGAGAGSTSVYGSGGGANYSSGGASTYGSGGGAHSSASPTTVNTTTYGGGSTYNSSSPSSYSSKPADDFSAEISIGVIPSKDVSVAHRNRVDDDNDLNALVAELETSGSQFNSKYGVGGGSSGYDNDHHHSHTHHRSDSSSSSSSSDDDKQEDDPLAAALASLEHYES